MSQFLEKLVTDGRTDTSDLIGFRRKVGSPTYNKQREITRNYDCKINSIVNNT